MGSKSGQASFDGTVRVWAVASGSCVRLLAGKHAQVVQRLRTLMAQAAN